MPTSNRIIELARPWHDIRLTVAGGSYREIPNKHNDLQKEVRPLLKDLCRAVEKPGGI